MRATDDRYRGEQAKFDLAIRMIRYEARTGTIRYFTGINDDRIRKLYSTYFKHGPTLVRRQRGRSPSRVSPLVRTPLRTLESGVFVNLLLMNGLLSLELPPGPPLKGSVELGHRLCECYETFGLLVPRSSLTFEWGWNLLASMRRGDELGISACESCSICHLFDLLAVPRAVCPACVVLRRGDPVAANAS